MCYLRRSGPVPVVVVAAVNTAVPLMVDVVVVVEPVFIVGMTAADSFSLSRSAPSSDQYLYTHTHTHTEEIRFTYRTIAADNGDGDEHLRLYLLVRLVEPVRDKEEPRLESRPRWPVGEVTDEEVVVVVEEEVAVDVVEELRSSCRLPKEPL